MSEVAGKLCGIYESHGADRFVQHECLPQMLSSAAGFCQAAFPGDLSGGVAVFKSANASDPYLCALLEIFGHFVPEEGTLFKSDSELFSRGDQAGE
ncbi:MAG: hypothetical protein ACLR78_10440 [Roseburia sp.]